MPLYLVKRPRKGGHVWQARHSRFDSMGRRQVENLGIFKTKKAGERRLADAELIATARGGRVTLADFERPVNGTFAELREDWLTTTVGAAPATRKNHIKFSLIFAERWAHIRPVDLTAAHVREWVREAATVGKLSRLSIENQRNVLGPMLDHAEFPHANVARHKSVVGTLPRRVKAKKYIPPLADIAAVAAELEAEPRHLAVYRMLVFGGLRHGEALAVTPGDIDRRRRRLVGVGTKADRADEETSRDVEVLPFQPDWLPPIFEGVARDEPIVGPNLHGNTMRKQDYGRVLERAQKRAGVRPFSPKVLRDFHASWLMLEDGHVHHLGWAGAAERLGNSVPVLSDTYTQVVPPEASEDGELPEWFRPRH